MYSSSYTSDTNALADNGLVLPLVVTNRAESTVRLERLGSRWQPRFETRYERFDFPSGSVPNGEELVITPSLWRKLGRVHAIGVAYVFQQGWSEAPHLRVHGALFGLGRRPAKGFGYRFEGGGAYLEDGTTTAIGIAELSLSRRHTRLAARYERTVREGFGLGRLVFADVASLSISRDLARRLTFVARGTAGINTDPSDPAYRYRSDTYSGVLQWAVTRDLSADAGWSYWRSASGTEEPTPSSRGWVSLGYRLGW